MVLALAETYHSNMIVNRHGLHIEGGLVFLHEGPRSRCLTEGFNGLESPFEVVRSGFGSPHSFLSGVDEYGIEVEVPDHPLVRAMAPVPSTKSYWVDSKARGAIENLVLMSSPTGVMIHVPWATDMRRLAPRFSITNLTPIIIAGYEFKDVPVLRDLIQLPRTRPLLFCGPVPAPGVDEVIPAVDLIGLGIKPPWRAIGISLLMNWIRDEERNCDQSGA